MKRILFFITLAAVLTLGACNTKNESINTKFHDQDGVRTISNENARNGNDADLQDPAGELPSEENPNMLNLSGDNNPTLEDSATKAKDVINRQTGYEAGAVWINGRDMTVTVHKKGTFEGHQERNREQARLQWMLIKALPRYNVKVNLEENGS
ncbi:hypothetical protein D0469_04610 [Peribacillus saganii]|uniref:Sporulation protein n=1 Tax=Peribacillus saganii TaxID=2303992 RepID=A0A372LRM5_9BACI|nr:membrane lipoprotein lipid attachment site-containing protein [Peribacillus saganii]RFU70841.1 hypothetical protein D0469_04610 [Peribacillus saganii]